MLLAFGLWSQQFGPRQVRQFEAYLGYNSGEGDSAFAEHGTQLFGGNGLTKEYPLEKLFRDARAARIEDGENHLLAMKFGYLTSLLRKR